MNCTESVGVFEFEVWDKHGLLARWWFPNTTTTAGRNYMQNAAFRGASQTSTWYLGLISEADFDALAVGDTMSSHTGWTENENYSQSTRPEWASDAASGGAITNGTRATFTINATTSIVGAFLTTNNTKGGTSGTLFSTGRSSVTRKLVPGQSLKVTYTHTLKAGGS